MGYIVAGLLVGPYVCGASWVHETESVSTWGEVGVIFLLFSLGLEFSFKKLVKMGSTAIIACLTIVIGMMTVGFLLGRSMGWNQINSLFLGGMLCMSSTTIVFKALDDLGLRQKSFAGICFGILVVEDLFAVVLMVLLASIAVKQTFDGQEMFMEVVKLVAYLLFWFVAGLSLLPTLLRVCRKHLSDETLTILSLGLCLGMVLLAEGAGFSSALGAFVMGSILAETIEAEHIEHLVAPIKNMFGAVFFVSVGMMIDPALLLQYWLPITLITLTVIAGQIVFATLGIVLSGQSLQVGMQSAFALTQVGEFAFIIANFGSEKGVTEPWLYPVIVAVSVITTFLTPYVIRLAEPAYQKLDRILPTRWKIMLDLYARQRKAQHRESQWRLLLRRVALALTLYTVTSIFVISLWFSLVSDPIVNSINGLLPQGYSWVGRGVSLIALLMIIAPFLYQILNKHRHSNDVHELWQNGSYHRGGIVGLNLTRIVLSIILIILCVFPLFDATYIVVVLLALVIIFIVLKTPEIQRRSQLLEHNFMSNLSAREKAQHEKEQTRQRTAAHKTTAAASKASKHGAEEDMDDELHFEHVLIPAQSVTIGQSLQQLDLRNTVGVSVIRILRDSGNVNNPSARERFREADRIVISGTLESIELFKRLVRKNAD